MKSAALKARIATGRGYMNKPVLTSMRETAYGQAAKDETARVVTMQAAEQKRNRKLAARAHQKCAAD